VQTLARDTMAIIENRWGDIERVAAALLEHVTLDASQIYALLDATPIPQGWNPGKDIVSVAPSE
jgi:hypothetical protein